MSQENRFSVFNNLLTFQMFTQNIQLKEILSFHFYLNGGLEIGQVNTGH